ncbi:hypothetical protein C8J56DRAFT_1043420 [Mycena floridula]|nr:hypothetical protein C8J56DRAFT_1043420 [Mycena floridula]
MARTKATAVARLRALGIASSSSSRASSPSPSPPTVRPKKSTTTKKTAAAKKSTTNARAASPDEREGKKSKYERYYENNHLQRKKDANSWYERVGRERRQKAAAAKKADKEAAKAAAFNDTEQLAAVEESLAYITIRKVKQDMMVWKIRDGGFQVWGEWEANDERRVELKRQGEMIWFRAISLFQHYEPPQDVDEAVQIYNISMEVTSMLRIGLQAL